jgi:hypothetical protein
LPSSAHAVPAYTDMLNKNEIWHRASSDKPNVKVP